MNLFKNKNIERKIGPKFAATNVSNFDLKKLKPRLYEEKINFDCMRMFRLQRIREQMENNEIGATILFDPINIRYATDARNMSLFTMHTLARFVFIPQSGPVILYDYPKSKHLSQNLCTINEVREVTSWDFFSSGNKLGKNVKIWSQQVNELMHSYSIDNNRLAIDICDPVGIQVLQNSFNFTLCNAQNLTEKARSIKSSDELICIQASIEVAEKGINLIHEKLKAGQTEEELWSYFHKVNIENGGEWFETRLFTSGPRTNPWLQECSNRIIEKGDLVAFDTDMVGPYGYCADISRTFVEGGKLNDEQKRLHDLAVEHIKYNEQLIKAGTTFREFAEKSWKLPAACYDNHYPCQVHGIGMCDEWPFILYPNEDYSNGDFSGMFEENMTITIESYIGEVGGREGVKLEDQYLVTRDGLKRLTNHPLNYI